MNRQMDYSIPARTTTRYNTHQSTRQQLGDRHPLSSHSVAPLDNPPLPVRRDDRRSRRSSAGSWLSDPVRSPGYPEARGAFLFLLRAVSLLNSREPAIFSVGGAQRLYLSATLSRPVSLSAAFSPVSHTRTGASLAVLLCMLRHPLGHRVDHLQKQPSVWPAGKSPKRFLLSAACLTNCGRLPNHQQQCELAMNLSVHQHWAWPPPNL